MKLDAASFWTRKACYCPNNVVTIGFVKPLTVTTLSLNSHLLIYLQWIERHFERCTLWSNGKSRGNKFTLTLKKLPRAPETLCLIHPSQWLTSTMLQSDLWMPTGLPTAKTEVCNNYSSVCQPCASRPFIISFTVAAWNLPTLHKLLSVTPATARIYGP